MPKYLGQYDHESDHVCGECERTCDSCGKQVCELDPKYRKWSHKVSTMYHEMYCEECEVKYEVNK